MLSRRAALKGAGLGIAAILIGGGATYYYSLLKHLQRKPLIIGGSTVVKRFVGALAQTFVNQNPNIDLLVEGGHSYSGLVALQRGSVELAMMSHDFTPAENKLNLHNYLIGIEAIAIVVNANAPIDNISSKDARDVFERKITNWKQLGGKDAPINLYSREDGSTTKLTIEQVLLQGAPITQRSKELSSSKEMAQEVGLDPLGIGFLSVRDFTAAVKPLKVDEVAIDEKTVLLKLYPLVRDLFLVRRDDSSQTAQQFLNYVLSNDGQSHISQNGAMRVR